MTWCPSIIGLPKHFNVLFVGLCTGVNEALALNPPGLTDNSGTGGDDTASSAGEVEIDNGEPDEAAVGEPLCRGDQSSTSSDKVIDGLDKNVDAGRKMSSAGTGVITEAADEVACNTGKSLSILFRK